MTSSPIHRFQDWYFALEQAAWENPVISRNGEPSGAIPGSPTSGGKSDANFHGPFKAARRLNLFTGNPRVQPSHQSARQFANRLQDTSLSVAVLNDEEHKTTERQGVGEQPQELVKQGQGSNE